MRPLSALRSPLSALRSPQAPHLKSKFLNGVRSIRQDSRHSMASGSGSPDSVGLGGEALGGCFLKMVGTARFELTTSCSQSRRSTRLSYVPKGWGRESDTTRSRTQGYFTTIPRKSFSAQNSPLKEHLAVGVSKITISAKPGSWGDSFFQNQPASRSMVGLSSPSMSLRYP